MRGGGAVVVGMVLIRTVSEETRWWCGGETRVADARRKERAESTLNVVRLRLLLPLQLLLEALLGLLLASLQLGLALLLVCQLGRGCALRRSATKGEGEEPSKEAAAGVDDEFIPSRGALADLFAE